MQLNHAQQQIIGQVALGYESGMNELLSITRSVIMNEPLEYMEDIIRKVNAVTASDIMETANLVFDKKQLSTLIFEGKEE